MVTFAKELKMLLYGFFGLCFVLDHTHMAPEGPGLPGPVMTRFCLLFSESQQYWVTGDTRLKPWSRWSQHQFCNWWWFSCTPQIPVTSAIVPLHQNSFPILSSHQQRALVPPHSSLPTCFLKAKLNDLSLGQSTILCIEWCLTCPRSSPIGFSQG